MEHSHFSTNFRIKKGVADAITVEPRDFPYHVDMTIHDIPLRFYVKSEVVIDQLYGLYPVYWFKPHLQKPLKIYWLNNHELGFNDEQWEDESDFDCHVYQNNEKQVALQRDFLGQQSKDHTILVCPYEIGDGFYNFLRWFAPKYFFQNQKLLLHSSCVLDSQREAYFCLGPSGAGKSTMASLMNKKRVLGDDMNVIKVADGKLWAQAGALGQAITNPREYGRWYPVKGFLWLEKSESFQLENLQKSEQMLKFCSAIANVFWSRLDLSEMQTIMQLSHKILEIADLKVLKFPIHRDVWPYVWQNFSRTMSNQEEL